jgi:hypothetical protein
MPDNPKQLESRADDVPEQPGRFRAELHLRVTFDLAVGGLRFDWSLPDSGRIVVQGRLMTKR